MIELVDTSVAKNGRYHTHRLDHYDFTNLGGHFMLDRMSYFVLQSFAKTEDGESNCSIEVLS